MVQQQNTDRNVDDRCKKSIQIDLVAFALVNLAIKQITKLSELFAQFSDEESMGCRLKVKHRNFIV